MDVIQELVLTKPQKKAAKRIYTEAKGQKPASVKFSLRETTRGSKKDVDEYRATRTRLAKPRVFERNGNRIEVKWQYKIKAL